MSIDENQLKELLDEAGNKLVSINQTYGGGLEFQTALFQCLNEICIDKGIKCDQTGAHTFPDIIIDSFGVEAKLANGDKWSSTGNSVTESTKMDSLKVIYIFFMKQHLGKQEFKYKKYENCLSDIVVTHSPRYTIDMELVEGNSVFERMGVSYGDFNKDPNKMRSVRKFLKSKVAKGQELWWLDEENESITPIIKDYSTLSKTEKENFVVESFILFPELLSSSKVKFIRPAVYLLKKQQVINSHLRDEFTAGGRIDLQIGSNKYSISRVFYNLFKMAKEIKGYFTTINLDLIKEYWNISEIERDNIETKWLGLIDTSENDEGITASKIYKAGLVAE